MVILAFGLCQFIIVYNRLRYVTEVKQFVKSNTVMWYKYIFPLWSLGQSVEFRTIWALEISNNPKVQEPSEPKIRFVAGIHGNAPVGTELLLEFAASLCINYGKNAAITKVSWFSCAKVTPLIVTVWSEDSNQGCVSQSQL